MSVGKMPGIKGLVSGAGSQGRRRFKSDLSVDMISPPMGDFRHTMHVGRGGDVFGDTSFLSNHGGKGGGEEPGSPDSSASANGSSKTAAAAGFFTRTFRTVRSSKAPETNPPRRPRGGSRDLSSPPPPPVSPIIKNAISLPQLNIDCAPNGCSQQRALFPGSVGSADDSFYTYGGLQSGFATLPRLSRLDRQFQDGGGGGSCALDSGGITLTRADSFTSFTVDLGPSLMSEVLSLIDDRHSRLHTSSNHHGQEAEGELEEESGDDDNEGGTSSSLIAGTFEDSPVIITTSSADATTTGVGSRDASLRGSAAHGDRERSHCGSRDEDGTPTKTTPPADASMGSPPAVEPLMEAERFQRAADMLSRHYGGGGSFTQGRSPAKDAAIIIAPAFTRSQKTAYTFSEEEEEIKV